MIRCESCDWIGSNDELIPVETSYEEYYDTPIRGFHPLTIYRCPCCGEEEDLTEFDQDLEEEFCAEELKELREEIHSVHEFRRLSDILLNKAEEQFGLDRKRVIKLSESM